MKTAGDLNFDFRPILEGKADIFFIENCDKINHAVPLVFIKLRDYAVRV